MDSYTKTIRICGDIHGKYDQYFNIVHNSEYSVQLGDCGFHYEPLNILDSSKHKFFFGNHDSRDAKVTEHFLGYYGFTELNGVAFFYVSGGHSIDRAYRLTHEHQTGQKIWWEDEELSYADMQKVYKWYKDVQPQLVITHEAPTVCMEKIQNPNILKEFGYPDGWKSNTQQLLQQLYEEYQPQVWVHGHMHHAARNQIDRTLFISLQELGYVDVDEEFNVSGLMKSRKDKIR